MGIKWNDFFKIQKNGFNEATEADLSGKQTITMKALFDVNDYLIMIFCQKNRKYE